MNIGDLFDSPWKLLIVAAVIIILFGSRKLPYAARSLGRSMRILKAEVSGMHKDDDDEELSDAAAAAKPKAQALPAASPEQQRIDELQQQVRELQQQTAAVAAAPEAQRAQQAS